MPTTIFLFANNATTTLAQPLRPSNTLMTVAPGTGNLFPFPVANEQFAITLMDPATGLIMEICYATQNSGDIFTIIRAQENTTALDWPIGTIINSFITAGTANTFYQSGTLGTMALQNADAVTISGGTIDNVNFNELNLKGATTGTTTLVAASDTTTYTFTLPATAGSNGYVLATDGVGVTTWASGAGSNELIVDVTTIASGTTGSVLIDNAGVLGELPVTGTGNVVLSTDATLITPNIGDATATSINGLIVANTDATLTLYPGSQLLVGGPYIVELNATNNTLLTLPSSGTVTALGNAKTGTGSVVLATAPTLSTPVLGDAIATSIVVGSPSGGNIGAGTINATGLFVNGVAISGSALTIGSTPIANGNSGFILYDNSGVVGNLATIGSGSVVLANSPILISPTLGAANATSINGLTITASTGTLTIPNGGTLRTTGAYSVNFTVSAPTSLTLPSSGTVTALGNVVTGSGSIVLSTNPALTNPNLGNATGASLSVSGTLSGASLQLGTAGSIEGQLFLSGSTSGTVTVKSAVAAGTWSLTLPTNGGAAGQFLQTTGGGVTTWAAAPGVVINTTTITGGTSGYILFNNAGTVGQLPTTGTGSVVLSNAPSITSPTLITPSLGIATATTINGLHIGTTTGTLNIASGVTLTINGFNVALTAVGATSLTLPTSGTVTALGNVVTGTGSIVLANSPTLIGPTLGNATATSLVVGSPSGGSLGAGTINATGVYVNGVAVGTVTKITAGTNVTISPTSGVGNVTINATAGSGGVSQIIAGTNVTIDPLGGTGAVTINASGGSGSPGGVTGQMQYNDAAAFAGASMTYDGNGGYLIPSPTVAETALQIKTYGSIPGLVLDQDNNGQNISLQWTDNYALPTINFTWTAFSYGYFGIQNLITGHVPLSIVTDDSVLLGAATGGSFGQGTINATGYYKNGVELINGSAPSGSLGTLQLSNGDGTFGSSSLVQGSGAIGFGVTPYDTGGYALEFSTGELYSSTTVGSGLTCIGLASNAYKPSAFWTPTNYSQFSLLYQMLDGTHQFNVAPIPIDTITWTPVMELSATFGTVINAPPLLESLGYQLNYSLTVNGQSGIHSTQIADASNVLWNAGYLEIPIATESDAAISGQMLVLGSTAYPTGFTIPTNNPGTTLPWFTGSIITIYNSTLAPQPIDITTGTLTQVGTGLTGIRYLAPYGLCSVINIATDSWIISGTGVT